MTANTLDNHNQDKQSDNTAQPIAWLDRGVPTIKQGHILPPKGGGNGTFNRMPRSAIP